MTVQYGRGSAPVAEMRWLQSGARNWSLHLRGSLTSVIPALKPAVNKQPDCAAPQIRKALGRYKQSILRRTQHVL